MSYKNSKTLNTIYLPERLLPSDAKRISEPDEFGRGVKFVRAETLLKWAKEEIRTIANEKYDYYAGKRVAFQQVIDKLNSL